MSRFTVGTEASELDKAASVLFARTRIGPEAPTEPAAPPPKPAAPRVPMGARDDGGQLDRDPLRALVHEADRHGDQVGAWRRLTIDTNGG